MKLSEKMDAVDQFLITIFRSIIAWCGTPIKKDKDFERAIGKHVYIKTYEPIEGAKEFEGELQSFDGETVTLSIRIKTRTKTVVLPYDKVAFARLAIVF